MVPLVRIERTTSPLPRECSTTELQRRRAFSINLLRKKLGAGEGNRTLVVSLEGFCSTIELHPRREILRRPPHPNQRCYGGGGWIRTNVGARPTDLQSAPFNRSGTPPNETADCAWFSQDCQCSLARISLSRRRRSGFAGEIALNIPAGQGLVFAPRVGAARSGAGLRGQAAEFRPLEPRRVE